MNIKVLAIALLIVLLAACSAPASPHAPVLEATPQANMPNPASVYCEEQGYRSEIRTAADGSQSGVCIFGDNSECDEWAYYRGACSPKKENAEKLDIRTHELKARPDSESMKFTSLDGREFSSADLEVGTPFPSNQVEGDPFRLTLTIGTDVFVASQFVEPCEFEGCITVTQNGAEIFRTDAGGISPINPLQGLWTFDGHWVLETNRFLTDTPFNGQIFIGEISLNEQNGYDESFGFQTIGGRPFYFFRRDGKVDAWFDGTEIPLGYDDVPHYRCCSDATLNPRARQEAVLFFGNKGEQWYFEEMALPALLH
jgi:putative hemolysin